MSQTARNSGYDNGGGGGIHIPAVIRSFKKQIIPMLIIFALLAALGWYFGGKMKRTYTAGGTIMVTLGDEYVYNPLTGGNTSGGGLVTTPDSITLNEIGIMQNPELLEQVMGEVGPSRLFPEDARKLASSNRTVKLTARNDMLKKFESSFRVAAVPKSSIINMNFEHENPEVAVQTLNATIDAYMSYRRTLFDEGASEVISQQREATEEQLRTVDNAIGAFLRKNGLADFDSERGGVQKRSEELRTQLNATRAAMSESEAALAATEDTLRRTEPTIDLYREDRVQARLAQAELERKQLLAKYLPSSNPVRAKEMEIAEIRQLMTAGGGSAQGGRRTGPNTVYQGLETERAKHQALADSLREKEIVLVGQLRSAEAKLARMTSLSPTHQNLLREKKTLEARLEGLNAREQDALVRQETAEARSDNVKIINRASLPRKGRNMKKIVRFVSLLGAAMTALMVGLLGVFLDPSIYGGSPSRGTRSGDGRGRRNDDYQPTAMPVPEPVQPYQPQTPMPDYQPNVPYAPAAQAGAVGAAAYAGTQYDTGYAAGPTPYVASEDQTAAYYNQPYVDPVYGEQPQMTGTDGYAYGHVQTDNPYAAALAAQGAPAMQAAPTYEEPVQYVLGPNGEQVPVIGQTPYQG